MENKDDDRITLEILQRIYEDFKPYKMTKRGFFYKMYKLNVLG